MGSWRAIPIWMRVVLVIIGVVIFAEFSDRIDWDKVGPVIIFVLAGAFIYGVWQLFMVHVPAIAKASKETAEHLRAIRERLEATPPPAPDAPPELPKHWPRRQPLEVAQGGTEAPARE